MDRANMIARLADLDDGTGDLGVIVDQALADDPDATDADVREIILQARADWKAERLYQEQQDR